MSEQNLGPHHSVTVMVPQAGQSPMLAGPCDIVVTALGSPSHYHVKVEINGTKSRRAAESSLQTLAFGG